MTLTISESQRNHQTDENDVGNRLVELDAGIKIGELGHGSRAQVSQGLWVVSQYNEQSAGTNVSTHGHKNNGAVEVETHASSTSPRHPVVVMSSVLPVVVDHNKDDDIDNQQKPHPKQRRKMVQKPESRFLRKRRRLSLNRSHQM